MPISNMVEFAFIMQALMYLGKFRLNFENDYVPIQTT